MITYVEFLDYHLKFTIPRQLKYKTNYLIFRSSNAGNMPLLVEWDNQHLLPEELCILRNIPDPAAKAINVASMLIAR